MTKVYLISVYNEHGAECVRATLDKEKIRHLLATHPELKNGELGEEYETTLNRLLEEDLPGGPSNLGMGWGGFQLHIVELE